MATRDATPEEYQETDYKGWLLEDVWSREEASHLLHGVKPRIFGYVNGEWLEVPKHLEKKIKSTAEDIRFSATTGVIQAEKGNKSASLKYDEYAYHVKFYPKTYIEWAIRKELDVPKPLLDWYEAQQKPVRATKANVNKEAIPVFRHQSELLDILHETITEFWENAPKKSPPKQNAILEWLAKKYPDLTDKERKAIELIIRPNRNKRGQKTDIKYR